MADQVTTSLAQAKVLVMQGMKGKDGEPGPEGVSPVVSFEPITVDGRTGNKMTVTDAAHPSGQSINILNGKDGEEGSGGGAVSSVNGKTGAVVLNATDVGALPADTPIPDAVTEQTVSGWGFTKNTGTYSKPSGGIPKTDLAADVQTSLGKADTALQQHQSLSGYATETYVQQQIAAIPDELPSVSATDNGKVLGVVNGAWAVKAEEGGDSSAPFEIPITESGGTYSTTATAEEILAHADNCVVKQGGSAIYQTAYGVQGSNALIVFSNTDSINGFIQNVTFTVAVTNGTVTIGHYEERVEDKLPAVTTANNGDFLRVVNGAWAAATVPSAESNSFGGGS